jgi:hypothetical protein
MWINDGTAGEPTLKVQLRDAADHEGDMARGEFQ